MPVLKTRIFTVTGTKGKTSVVRALHYAVQSVMEEPVLLVDTHRILLGDKKIATFMQSRETSGLVPTVCPGRFLLSLANVEHPVAILEASVGSSQEPGLGYRVHEVGIFTNVYDDHIGVKEYLQNRNDLAAAKSFIFKYIQKDGYAIFNADDPLVDAQRVAIPKDKGITSIACTLRSDFDDSGARYIVSAIDSAIVLKEGDKVVSRVDFDTMPWLLGGLHEPTLRNGLTVIAGLWAFSKGNQVIFNRAVAALRSYTPDEDGGRMLVRTADNGVKVIIDFAHEAESLSHIAQYARTLGGGKVIGIVRLSGGRPDDHIISTSERFAPYYDELIIYEKTHFDDGLYKKFQREPGDVGQLIQEGATNRGVTSTIVGGEAEALTLAAEKSRSGDIVVYIIDSPLGSYELANSKFHFTEKTI